jgi:TPR repeat protein
MMRPTPLVSRRLDGRLVCALILLAGAPALATPAPHQAECERGDLDECARRGLDVLEGRGGAKPDPVAAINLLERGCFTSNSPPCEELSNRLPHGADFVELLRVACDGNGLRACVDLGGFFEHGQVVAASDMKRAVALYQRACKGGEPRGCTNLGLAYQRGNGGLAKDEKRALALFEQACQAGSRVGCVSVGDLYLDTNAATPKDDAKARHFYAPACQQGLPHACNALAVLYDKGRGGPADDPKAETLYIQACEGDDAPACANLAGRELLKDRNLLARRPDLLTHIEKACADTEQQSAACTNLAGLYANGHSVAQNDKRAAELYQHACDQGVGMGCVGYAQLQANGRGVPADEKAALHMLDSACQQKVAGACEVRDQELARIEQRDGAACTKNDANACAALADRFWWSEGRMGDAARARAIYDARCQKGTLESCRRLAIILSKSYGQSDGEGGRDDARSVALLTRACDGKLADGCASLALFYSNGRGVARDPARALALEEKACSGGSSYGCFNLGNAYGDGRFATKDAVRARNAYDRGCKLDFPPACFSYAMALHDGDEHTRDLPRALQLFERACARHMGPACAAAASMYSAGEGAAADPDQMRSFLGRACDEGVEDACTWLKQNR